jgi:hypothetical protein
MSYKRSGRPNPGLAAATLTGAAWRTAYEPYDQAVPELRECAELAGDQAAQVCADATDYYAVGSNPDKGWPDRCRIIRQRLTVLAEQIAGHPVQPTPRRPLLEAPTVPRTPSWADDSESAS